MESMFTNSNAGQMVVASECSDRAVTVVADSISSVAPSSFNMQNSGTPQGSVAILWDIENCPVPNDVRPEDVAGNIRMALRVHPIISGAITIFSAYGDFNAFPRRVREGCQRTGVKLVDVPNGRKDAADKAILVDMFLFALDNRPPSYIMLISGDVDFAPALHILGQRGYTVILVIPSGVGVSSALSNAGRFVWDWPSVARGEGFVPNTRPSYSGYYAENQEEEAIVYRGLSQSFYNSFDFSVVSRSLSECTSGNFLPLPCYPGSSRSQSLQPGTSDVVVGSGASTDRNEASWWVQPGDMNGLKGQLIKLLELSGGCMTLTRVPAEYQKFFGRPLYMSEYGASKLIHLLKRMSDVMAVDGRGLKRFVYLRNSQMDRRGLKGKCTQEDVVDPNIGCGSSDELSDEERVVLEECNDKAAGSKTSFCTPTLLKREDKEKALELFKYELMEMLVSYSGTIFVSCFEDIYKLRYKKSVDYLKLGANDLEDLLRKMRDVVDLRDDPGSKKKYLAAAGM